MTPFQAMIEGATSGRLICEERGRGSLTAAKLAHRAPHTTFINASFAYARPCAPNRFSPADHGAWYTALDAETCLAKVSHHLTQALADAGDFQVLLDCAEMLTSMAGMFVDPRQMPDHPNPRPEPSIGYPVGNAVAAATKEAGRNGVIYPSVRHTG